MRERLQVVFDATETHAREGPEAFLATFRGDLRADVPGRSRAAR